MNTTTNYGLKQYEGTDLFNPLTVENVNMGDIDTALKAVSDHAVGAATELTTGTVHAITRSDTDRNVFAFVATSNYESGDTFTLDGTQVSALTPDGQPLATGSYVIGSTVLCALHDTLITVYVNPAKAKDSDKLDGHDSSYFATDSDLDTVAGTIGAISDKVGSAVLTTTAPDLSGAVNELNTHLGNPINLRTVTQSGETFTVANLSEYRYLLVLVTSADNAYIITQVVIPVAFAKTMSNVHRYWMANTYDGTRYFGRVDVQNINSNELSVAFSTSAAGVYIYGIK